MTDLRAELKKEMLDVLRKALIEADDWSRAVVVGRATGRIDRMLSGYVIVSKEGFDAAMAFVPKD